MEKALKDALKENDELLMKIDNNKKMAFANDLR